MCNDRGLSVLEQYGLEAGGRIPGAGGALICETQEGLVLIREYWGTARKLEHQAKLLEKISRGLSHRDGPDPEQQGRFLYIGRQ